MRQTVHGWRSNWKQNLSLYAKHGFEHQYDQNAGDLTYAYLRKILGEAGDEPEAEQVARSADDGDRSN